MLMKLRGKKGQGLVEYALIIALISVVAIVTLRAIGTQANTKLDTVQSELAK